MSKAKYIKGPKIRSAIQLASIYEHRGFIYWRHKVLHWGWWASMPLITLDRAIFCGYLYMALPKTERAEKKIQEEQ